MKIKKNFFVSLNKSEINHLLYVALCYAYPSTFKDDGSWRVLDLRVTDQPGDVFWDIIVQNSGEEVV